jgi:hypothetical protein
MTRDQIIQVFTVRALPAERQELRRTLEKMTTEQLEEAYKIVQLQAKEEELLEIQAEREANRIWHQTEMEQAREPQRKAEAKAQLAQDRQTFADAAKTLRSFAVNEANFNVIRQTLGAGFSIYAIQQMLAGNAAVLSPPTQEELNEWDRAAIEAHNLRLLSMDIPTLRKLAREAGARGPVAPPPDETQRVRQAERADGYAYPVLPDEFRDGNGPEEALDAKFLKKCSKETFKFLLKRYGSAQIDEALRTRRPDASSMW